MKLVFSSHLVQIPFDCKKWTNVRPTACLQDKGQGYFDKFEAIIVSGAKVIDSFNRAAELLLVYKIYPEERMKAKICTEDGRVRKDALILQRIFLGILGFEAAVRVVDHFDVETEDARKMGYSYVALQGHPERGVVTFSLDLNKKSQELFFSIESWSNPANWFVGVLSPFTRFIQKRSNRQAIEHFKSQV